MKHTNQLKRRCRNCEFANSRITRWPFVFCYLKGYMKLRCSRCKFHYNKTKHNTTNTL